MLVYDSLRAQLNLAQRDWIVVYSARWMSKPEARKPPRTGEADFLLAHPQYGVVVAEVKGGKIQFSGGKWNSIDGSGERFEIDPFAQVERNAYELAWKFDQMRRWTGGSKHDKYARWVIFPDSTSPAGVVFPPDYDSRMVSDCLGMSRLVEGLIEAAKFWYGDGGWKHPAAAHARKLLLDLFAEERSFTNPLSANLADEERKLERLTDSQFNVVSSISANPRVAIAGGAGSGKTWLARKRAMQLGEEGFRVLLTCQSYKLAKHLNDITPLTDGLVICAYDELLQRLAVKSGSNDESEYGWQLADLMMKAPDLSFDAVFVDEGQDFTETQWPFVEGLLGSDKQGIFYVFYDDNQQLSNYSTVLPTHMVLQHLHDNVRTTRSIHKDMVGYYQGQKEQRPRGPNGRSVERINSSKNVPHCIRRVIAKLIKSERFCTDDIVVLTPVEPIHSVLQDTGLVDGRKLSASPTPGRDVLLSSIRDFKGLERPVVIVCEFDRLPAVESERRRLLYTAYSRPKFHLILIDEPESESA